MHSAILAGGAASRYGGEPKGLLTVGGRRILDRLVEVCVGAVGTLPLLVANADDARGWRPDLRVVPDRVSQSGALGGLYTAVLEAPAPVLCVAWDMPFVTAALLKRLAEGLADHDVCLPSSGGRRGVEPLCAAYAPACAGPMQRCLDGRDFRAIAFHPAVRVETLTLEEVRRFGEPERLFFNVNTPEDLVRARTLDRCPL